MHPLVCAMASLREYLKLMRIHAAGAVWIVPAVGALAAAGSSVEWLHLAELFPVAVLTYVLAIVMNEYYDVEIDRALDALSTKPLVSGAIKEREAGWVCWIAGFSACALTLLFWGLVPLAWYVASVVVGAQYNIWGKRHYWQDLWFAIWAGMFCTFGAITATGGLPWDVGPLVLAISVMFFFRMVVVNTLSGGIKDLEHDQRVGAKTVPTWLGVRVRGGRVRYTLGYVSLEVLLEVGFVLALAYPVLAGAVAYSPPQLALICLLLVGMAITFAAQLPRVLDRDKVRKSAVAHEALGYMIVGMMVLDAAGLWRTSPILLVPLLWFALWTRLVYRKGMPTM